MMGSINILYFNLIEKSMKNTICHTIIILETKQLFKQLVSWSLPKFYVDTHIRKGAEKNLSTNICYISGVRTIT